MAKYRITDNVTGKTVTVEGNTPPTEADAELIFQEAGLREGSQPRMTKEQAISKQVPLNQPLQPDAEASGILPGAANFLMPNVAKYAKGSLQEIGAGNMMPTQPQANQQGLMDMLMSALGPGAQQVAGVAGIGSDLENQKNMGAREMAQTLQLAKSAAGGVQGFLNKGAETVTNIAGAKSINPWSVTRYGRDQAMQKAGDLNTTSLIKAGDEFVTKNPLAKEVWETFKPTIDKKMDAADLVGRMSDIFGQAYTKGGDVKSTADAALLNKLYQAGKTLIADQAPSIAKYTKTFKTLYNAPKAVQKASWLALKMTALGQLLRL